MRRLLILFQMSIMSSLTGLSTHMPGSSFQALPKALLFLMATFSTGQMCIRLAKCLSQDKMMRN